MKALSIAEALGQGMISVPETLWDGIKRTGQGLAFWDTEEEIKIGEQNRRAYHVLLDVIRYGIIKRNSPVEKAIRIILYNFYESLSPSAKEKVIEAAVLKGCFLWGKSISSAGLANYSSEVFIEQLAANSTIKTFLKFTMGATFSLLAMQGLLYKAGAASDRLRAKHPKLYQQLRAKNLDMIYFLIEKPAQKYLDAIRLKRMKMEISILF